MTTQEADVGPKAALTTPNDLNPSAVRDLTGALNVLLADMFALYLKTKNFHWHMSGPHFRDYHLLLDEQGDQLFAATDAIAERVRKIGGTTLHSTGHIGRLQRIRDNDAEYVIRTVMLVELARDNKQLAAWMRETHELCDQHGDVASASLLENWIDEAERRIWFLQLVPAVSGPARACPSRRAIMTHAHVTTPTQYVQASGIRFAHRRFGQDKGVPLVLMPHYRAGMDHWDPAVTDGLAASRPVTGHARQHCSIAQPDYETGKQRIRAPFRAKICERIALGAHRRMSQSKFFKPSRGLETLSSREKSLHNNDMCVADQEIFELPVQLDRISL
jgi:starvation-inducible DNA-binding protein